MAAWLPFSSGYRTFRSPLCEGSAPWRSSAPEHQTRVLGRIAEEVDAYRDGGVSRVTALNRIWALFAAAEIRDPSLSRSFKSVYYLASIEDDWLTAGLITDPGSEENFQSALRQIRDWVVRGSDVLRLLDPVLQRRQQREIGSDAAEGGVGRIGRTRLGW
jgi:hypothetical protein